MFYRWTDLPSRDGQPGIFFFLDFFFSGGKSYSLKTLKSPKNLMFLEITFGKFFQLFSKVFNQIFFDFRGEMADFSKLQKTKQNKTKNKNKKSPKMETQVCQAAPPKLLYWIAVMFQFPR